MQRSRASGRALGVIFVALTVAVALTTAAAAAEKAEPTQAEPRAVGPISVEPSYTWMDSAESDGPVYTAFDIRSAETLVVGGDDETVRVDLGAAFPLYGEEFTALWPTTNGFISTEDGSGWDYTPDCPLPVGPSSGGGHRIYAHHSDLVGGVYYQYFAESPIPHPRAEGLGASVFQWEVDYYWDQWGDWDPFLIWAVLYDSGDIVTQVGPGSDRGEWSSIGLQNAGPTEASLVTCWTDDAYGDTYAVWFMPRQLPESVGMVDPATGLWYLRDTAGNVTEFYYGDPGDYPFTGDWDCDGVDTPGLYRQTDGFVYLRNSNTQGNADLKFFFGDPGDVPLSGDFDGDGCDTVSVYRPSNAPFYIINELGQEGLGLGAADFWFVYGDAGDTPVVGDWNGDGADEVGMYRDTAGTLFCKDDLSSGPADVDLFYGDPGDVFLAGDWGDVDRIDSPGVFRPAEANVYLRFTLTSGAADAWFPFGEADWMPVSGRFDLD